MKNFLSVILSCWDVIFGFVVAFFKEYVIPKWSFDHSGLHTFVGKARNVAIEVSLRFNRWLALLLHSPTATSLS